MVFAVQILVVGALQSIARNGLLTGDNQKRTEKLIDAGHRVATGEQFVGLARE